MHQAVRPRRHPRVPLTWLATWSSARSATCWSGAASTTRSGTRWCCRESGGATGSWPAAPPAAFIELAPGAALTEEEVVAHCRAGLASFKVPRHVRFVTEWPMSSTKVQTFRLREQLEAELAARQVP